MKSNTVPLSHSAYLSIRSAIVSLAIEPGSFLLDRDIADLVGASRTPVREALARLEVEGWLESVPRKGYRVRLIDFGELPEISEMIASLEAAAATRLAKAPNAVVFSVLRELNEQLVSSLVDRGEPDEFILLDDQFHRVLLGEAAQYPLSGGVYSLLVDQLHRARLMLPPTAAEQDHHINEHRLLILSMELGDSQAASLLSRSHRMRIVERLSQLMVQGREAENATTSGHLVVPRPKSRMSLRRLRETRQEP
ncbi:GntR family transcriptional regulator [Ferrimicrobium sp.]|uniref:GntR family transcriptional regulator n=1 Tax=Ferrimicrobium sp. TaxID=2926050 RepID=UPI00261781F6|nr:GntR family transcriptional regulator [Ferrimicrobium sp.]